MESGLVPANRVWGLGSGPVSGYGASFLRRNDGVGVLHRLFSEESPMPAAADTTDDFVFLVIPLMILAATVIGVEYGWSTLRATLTRGVGRW